MDYTEYSAFGKTKLVPLQIELGVYASKGDGYEDTLWVERAEDWYAMLSPRFNNKRVRIIERDVWLRSETIKEKMQVTIKNVNVEWGGKPPKKWGKAVVDYDYNGSARKQNVMSFSNPEVFKKVQELVGQTVEVEVGKNDKDFTEWRSIQVLSGGSVNSGGSGSQGASATTTRVSGSNYETKEERAARQVLIVKQSSLSAAVATLTPGSKSALDPKAVLELAQEYTDWVFAKEEDASGFDTMTNDISF